MIIFKLMIIVAERTAANLLSTLIQLISMQKQTVSQIRGVMCVVLLTVCCNITVQLHRGSAPLLVRLQNCLLYSNCTVTV